MTPVDSDESIRNLVDNEIGRRMPNGIIDVTLCYMFGRHSSSAVWQCFATMDKLVSIWTCVPRGSAVVLVSPTGSTQQLASQLSVSVGEEGETPVYRGFTLVAKDPAGVVAAKEKVDSLYKECSKQRIELPVIMTQAGHGWVCRVVLRSNGREYDMYFSSPLWTGDSKVRSYKTAAKYLAGASGSGSA
jgi:hypothetical protein